MDNENNSSNLQNAINNYQEDKVENQMPALNTENATQETIVENSNNVDINNVKSVFEDMNISTQVNENTEQNNGLNNPFKVDNMDNAPITQNQPTPNNSAETQNQPTPNNSAETQNQQTPNNSVETQNPAPSVEVPQTNESVNLSSTTIGTIKPDKQKSPIAMIALFSFLLLFMIFMPEVLDFVNKNFGTNLEAHTGVTIEEPVEGEKEEQKITMYDFNDETVITLDKITIQSFIKSVDDGEYMLSFTIRNGGTQLYEFNKKLYFEFYDENSTFIGRTYLENITQITGGMTNNYKIPASKQIYDNAKKIELVQRTNDDYPNVKLVSDQLTCTNSKYNIVYTFDENQRLTYIRDMYTYTKRDDVFEYSSDLITYKSKIENLNRLDGVTAALTETDTGFITTVAIDYAYAEYSKLSSDTKYYMKDTYARIISFEMSSKGYDCR